MIAVLWIGFIVFVLLMLALDLGVLNRKAHVISTREALRWTGVCIGLALLFNVFVYFLYKNQWFDIGSAPGRTSDGKPAAVTFFTGYVIELSPSMDNIFVIALIFGYFGVPRIYQHRTLFWGIVGALVMRGAMIYAGTALIDRFDWVIYVFGALLLFTAGKMAFADSGHVEPERNPLVRLARRMYPVTRDFEGEKFFTRLDGKRAITPLFLVLLVIESTDVLFAIDSIPAIFAITTDPFIVFTSNVFAIICLRSMFFALAGMMDRFRYLKISLIIILTYVGLKMTVGHYLKEHHHVEIPTLVSLVFICLTLAGGMLASVKIPPRPPSPATDGPE